jgi:hypothetical protein
LAPAQQPAAHPAVGGVNPKTWTDLTSVESNAPSARYLSMMVYDPIDGYVLFFGGADATGALSDTWSFAHGQWTELSPSNSPSGRYLAGIAWDAADGYAVMFGGATLLGGGFVNDTWTYVHGTWTNITGTTNQTPGARWRPLMTYDAGDRYVLMYGGTTLTAADTDTWKFAHGNWTALTVSGSPPARFRASMVYDPVDNYTVVFGGCTSFACTSPDSSTWKYSNGTWAALSPTSHPAARVYYGETYSSISDTVLLYGGSTVPTAASGALSDTWSFTAANWSSLTSSLTTSPPKLAYLSMAFDPLDGYTVAYGGQFLNATYSNETWALGPSILGSIAVSPGSVDLGQTVTINATPIGHPGYVSYNYTTLPPGCVSANLSALTCTPNASGVFPVVVVLNDSGGVPSTENTTIAVAPDPSITSFTSSASTVTVGSTIVLNTSTSGGTGVLTYHYTGLPTGCGSANRASINCTPTAPGPASIQVNVTDAAHVSVLATVAVTVNAQPAIPQLTAFPSSLDAHQSLRLTAILTGGTTPIQYVWAGLPPGCASNDSVSLTCQPTGNSSGLVLLTATDADGWRANASAPVTVALDPAFTSGVASPAAVDVGTSVHVWANLTGGTGPFTYLYTGAPGGCALGNSPANTCIPTVSGNFTVEAEATDATGFSIFENFTVSVNNPMAAPAVTATPAAIDLGQNVTIVATPVGGTAPFTYSFVGLPNGCAATAPSPSSVSCTPKLAGTYPVAVTVKDALGQSMSGTGSVVVHLDPSVSLLAASGNPTTIGDSLALQANASNGSGSFTYTYTGLPTGCASRNTSALTCTPTATGNFLVTVKVRDSLGVLASAQSYANVTAKPSSSVLGVSSTTFDLLIVGIVVALVLIIAAAVVMMRRRQPAAPEPRAESEEWVEEPPT